MFTIVMKRAAFALLLTGAVVGAAEAQTVIPPDARRICKCFAGLFTLPEDAVASFHVTLDEYIPDSGVYVEMRFINPNGTVVKSKTTTIRTGGSASLAYSLPGLLRVQAVVFEPASNVHFKGEASVTASLSLNGTDIGRFIGPIIWVPIACEELNTQ